jgi:hypothetical protein
MRSYIRSDNFLRIWYNLNVRKACCTMFLYSGFRLGVRQAMADALTSSHLFPPSKVDRNSRTVYDKPR